MSDQDTPQSDATQEEAPASNPPPPTTSASASSNRGVMIILSYFWILALIPLLVEKDDKEVQWHAKNGLVLLAFEVVLYTLLGFLSPVPVLGCIFVTFIPLSFIGFTVIRLIAAFKGLNGERFLVPGLSQYADKF